MERHERFEPREYKHAELMDELNEFMITVKVHLFELPVKKPKPDLSEIDNLTHRLMAALQENSKPMRRS